MKGYNPNNTNALVNEQILNRNNDLRNDPIVNNTKSQKQDTLNEDLDKTKNIITNIDEIIDNNDTLSQDKESDNKTNSNKDINSKKTSETIKEKIYKGANTAETSIDKMRDFLVNLYMKFTQKEPINNYDAENVSINKILKNKEEIEDVNLKTENIISVSNNLNEEYNLTKEEIIYLKNLIKKDTLNSNIIKNYLTPEEKLNLISKIINNNIMEDINAEFKKVFKEPLIKENLNNKDIQTVATNYENKITLPSKENTITNSPIPSPFDPVKMDEENEKKEVNILEDSVGNKNITNFENTNN